MTKLHILTTLTAVVLLISSFSQCKFLPERIDSYKRTSSDQRIAELQALIALSRNVAHGQVDPAEIGKKRRDASSMSSLEEMQRNRFLRSLFQKVLKQMQS